MSTGSYILLHASLSDDGEEEEGSHRLKRRQGRRLTCGAVPFFYLPGNRCLASVCCAELERRSRAYPPCCRRVPGSPARILVRQRRQFFFLVLQLQSDASTIKVFLPWPRDSFTRSCVRAIERYREDEQHMPQPSSSDESEQARAWLVDKCIEPKPSAPLILSTGRSRPCASTRRGSLWRVLWPSRRNSIQPAWAFQKHHFDE